MIRIGASGWHYRHWRGPFYPQQCSPECMLDFYSRHFDTVEINNSFYRLPASGSLSPAPPKTPPRMVPAANTRAVTAACTSVFGPNGYTLGPKLHTIYIYFDNDQAGYAAQNAQQLKKLLTTSGDPVPHRVIAKRLVLGTRVKTGVHCPAHKFYVFSQITRSPDVPDVLINQCSYVISPVTEPRANSIRCRNSPTCSASKCPSS